MSSSLDELLVRTNVLEWPSYEKEQSRFSRCVVRVRRDAEGRGWRKLKARHLTAQVPSPHRLLRLRRGRETVRRSAT